MSESKAGKGVGARLRRKEDRRHLHGRGQFVSDIHFPGMLDAAFVRSSVAHGVIKSIDVPERTTSTRFRPEPSRLGLPPTTFQRALPPYTNSSDDSHSTSAPSGPLMRFVEVAVPSS